MSFKMYIELFFVFFKIGAFTFGGGFAMIPLIEKEIVMNKKWIEQDEIINFFTISQSIPGAIAINTSTLVGYKVGGKKGALIATIGVILPSFIIILMVATLFQNIADSKIVEAVFVGINGAVIAMILLAGIKMIKAGVKDIVTFMILMITLLGILIFHMSPIMMLLFGAVIGIIYYVKELRKKEAKES